MIEYSSELGKLIIYTAEEYSKLPDVRPPYHIAGYVVRTITKDNDDFGISDYFFKDEKSVPYVLRQMPVRTLYNKKEFQLVKSVGLI